MILKKITLTQYIFIGIILGVLGGWLFGESILPIADPLAKLFLRLLRMAIMPLIITSIISGVLSIGAERGLGRLGIKTFLYYITSSVLAIITGQILVNIFRPGVGSNIQLSEVPEVIGAADQSISDLLFRIIPENPFQSMAEGDVLPVIFFCIFLGFFITRLKDSRRIQLTEFFQGMFEAMMKLTLLIIWIAPLGVFGINARIVATTGFGAFKSLGFYFMVVLLGLFIHAFINLPLLLRFVGRVNPLKHYKGMTSALLTAFSTSSSMVTLPLTIKCVTTRSRVSKKIAKFMLPIGATVNMDGTALYECVATIFIAQIYGLELTIAQQGLIVLTALLASIGAAGIPMAGLVMMTIILRAIGLPLEGVGLILAVDRILDMFRTTTNVLSDSCGTVIVARLEGESLEKMGEPAEEEDN
ncbi:dicarboxylate/amino acid:cation symporter [candidate division KSB1 bacterium]|nr:dicarboxylate/amino acid:cation symporter [candidate division KSB1 bacterium]